MFSGKTACPREESFKLQLPFNSTNFSESHLRFILFLIYSEELEEDTQFKICSLNNIGTAELLCCREFHFYLYQLHKMYNIVL